MNDMNNPFLAALLGITTETETVAVAAPVVPAPVAPKAVVGHWPGMKPFAVFVKGACVSTHTSKIAADKAAKKLNA